MTTKYSTKKALISSIVVLALCFSMLIGTTFAWFTDSASSNGNIIKTGELDVEMYWADGKEDPATTAANVWNNASTGPIFNYDNWEPGYAEVRHVRISNLGTLALKYKVLIVADGAVSNLADVIDVYYADPAIQIANRAALANATKLGTLTDVLSNIGETGNGTLEAGSDDTITLALVMQESAGNEYMNKSIGTSFSIQVLATQLSYESDSFGNDYDADLELSGNGISRDLEDGSTVFYYNEESGYGDRVRLISLPENVGTEYVVPSEVNDLGGALNGVTLDKLTVPAGLEYGYKSLEGSNIDKVVIEDGMTTIPNRLFYAANVEEVVIPSSVTLIVDNVFQKSTIKTITIPASVETIGEAAFGASLIEKVIFEGNTAIQGYAFRGCTQLREVVLKGDDVTFITSTLNGRNSCWFCNGESNNPNTSNITFYVENTTVAERVKTAMGAEAGNTPVYVGESLFVTVKNATELTNVLGASYTDTIVYLTADIASNVTLNQNSNGKLVIDGNGHEFNGSIDLKAQSETNASGSITIKNVNFKTDAAELTFINSTVTNHYPLNVTVSNCTFEGSGAQSDVVGIAIKGAMNFTIENCTANKVHSILQNTAGWNLTVRDVVVTESGRGMSLGTVQGVSITNVEIEALKYGIRMDAAYNNNAVITDCNITAFIPVVVRKVSVDSNLTFNGENVMNETNTDNIWCAIGTSEYETNGVLPTAATKTVTVTLNDTGVDAAGICNNSGK